MKKIKIINYNINIKGSNVEGNDVTLDAKENLNITASETTNKLEQDSKSSSASVGVGFDIATGQVSSVTISGSKSKGEVDANSTSYNESTVKADKNLGFTSGKDTNIKGGKLSGEKVTGNVGGDLNIESKQDKNSYEEKNSSAGFGIGIDLSGQNKKDSQENLDKKDKVNNANKTGIFGSAGKSDVDSKYESVTDQSGIYAGKEGFDINVGENTNLKGGIISSEAEKDKNKISTGTLTYEDIKNKAEYEAGSTGINVDTSAGAEHKDAGVTPNTGVGAKDDAESTTKATVSEGEIEIRDKENQKQDLAGLNRDTKNSLNKLGEIFDKTKVQEKQEFAGMFQEIAHNYIGDLTGKISKEEKAFLNSFVDGLIAQWTSGDFLAGASGTALLESMQSAISEIEDPALKQIAAGALGAIAGEIVSGNAQAGASGAISTERDNQLSHEEQEKVAFRLEHAKTQEEKLKIIEEALAQSDYNRATRPGEAEHMEQYLLNELEKITKYDNNVGVSFEVNPDLGLHNNLIAAQTFFKEYNVVKHLPEVFGESVKLTASVVSAPINVAGMVITVGDTAYTLYQTYNEFGMSDSFAKNTIIDALKSGGFYIVDTVIPSTDIKTQGIVIIGKGFTSVFVDQQFKDKKVGE